MELFERFESQLKAAPKTIVFTEGTDARILSAASRLLAGGILKVILLGNPDDVQAAAAAGGFDVAGAEVIDPANYEGFDEMVAKMVELRKGKMTEEQCRAAMAKSNYFGTMLVKMGKADCLLGGATYSTADTVRPALQLIKCKPGVKSVSSSFIPFRKSWRWVTVRSILIRAKMRSLKLRFRLPRPLKSLALIRGLLCCRTPQRVPVRARRWTRCATLPPACRRITLNSRWMASCSLTQPLPLRLAS